MTGPERTTAAKTGFHLPSDDENLLEWTIQYGRTLAIGAGVIVVVAASVWLYFSSARRKEAFASQALTQARASVESGNMPLAASDLTRMIERFGGTDAADEGTILLNEIRLLQGQRDQAVTALQEFVRGRHPDHVAASAYALLGGGLEDQGKLREAGAAFREASRKATLDFLKGQYLIDAGRALAAAGDTAGARGVLAEVLQNYGELQLSGEARVRLAELGGEVPRAPKPSQE